MDVYRLKVEKITQMKKKVMQGDRGCVEVLRQRKEMEDTVEVIG